jgi:isopenicillin N synthase-like dioxygenase
VALFLCPCSQAGDALQALSGGAIRATRHGVRAPCSSSSEGLTRSTVALFMQPDVDHRMHVPPGVDPEQLGVTGFRPGLTFGGYCYTKL